MNMNEHTITRYEDELTDLNKKVLEMGGAVEKSLHRSMTSLFRHDINRANKVIEREGSINEMELEIDAMTRNILALRQPAASDLRFVITSIKVVTDLERIGDLSEGIAEMMLETNDHPLIQLDSLESMSDLVMSHLKLALDAFGNNNIEAAMQCIAGDKKVNQMYKAMLREYLTYMVEDPRQISSELIAANIAKNLERIGDHSVSISQMVVYMVKGIDVRHSGRKATVKTIARELKKDVDSAAAD